MFQSFLFCSLLKHINLYPDHYRILSLLCSKTQYTDYSIYRWDHQYAGPETSVAPNCSLLNLGHFGVTGDKIKNGQLWGREETSLAAVVARDCWIKRLMFGEVGWDHLWGALFDYEAKFGLLGLGSNS